MRPGYIKGGGKPAFLTQRFFIWSVDAEFERLSSES